MKFIISRTSIWDDNKQPCKEAIKEKYIYNDQLDPKYLSNYPEHTRKYIKEEWYKNGFNHREESEIFKREIEKEDWFIEINSIDELIIFIKKYGNLVISNKDKNSNYKYDTDKYNNENYEIEIYDNYRE